MPIMVDHKVGGVDRLAVSRLLRDAIEPEVGRATVVTRPPIYIVPDLSILQPLFLSMEINWNTYKNKYTKRASVITKLSDHLSILHPLYLSMEIYKEHTNNITCTIYSKYVENTYREPLLGRGTLPPHLIFIAPTLPFDGNWIEL